MYLFLCLIFLFAVGNVSAKSCSDLCAEEGAEGIGNRCYGTAPFCDGAAVNSTLTKGFPFRAPGECTSGSSCFSGSKQCSCYQKITDCAAACKAYYNNPKIPYTADCGYPYDDSMVDIVGICDIDSSMSVSFCICY